MRFWPGILRTRWNAEYPFATILTVSNHKPYNYPEGRIDLDPEQHKRENAVKYADWALGDFLDRASSHGFFKNTVFAILGDHGARVHGVDFIPIATYEVLLLIYAPSMLTPPSCSRSLPSFVISRATTIGQDPR